jgi:hypothetical protein
VLSPRKCLRVGILVDAWEQPAWVREIVRGIGASTFARVVAVVKRPDRPGRRRLRHLLHDLHARLDRLLFRAEPDASAPGDLRDHLRGCEILADEPARVRPHDLDVAIAFAPGFEAYAPLARDGVWRLGEGPDEALPGLLEVLEASPTTCPLVEAWRGSAPSALRASHGPTDHVSVERNRNALLWKRAALVLRELSDVAVDGPRAEWRPAPARPRPGNLRMAWLLARHALRYLRGKVRHLLSFEQWYLAYRFEAPARDGLDGLVDVVPPRDRFWADPFPVRTADGRTFVFLEELFYRDWKGRIAVVEIEPGKGAGRPRTVLERPYHMSYPQVFEWQGQHYMLPETAANRTVTLFRCVSFPDRWVEEKDLLRDIDAVDATLAEIDGCWWMFVNVGLPGAGNRDELHLYRAPSPLGPWAPHPGNPVKSDCRSARPAGGLFRRDGRLCRPAQNCGGAYGASIVLHRIDELSPEAYRETAVGELVPPRGSGASRIHTINRCEGLLVVDLLRRRRRFLA